MRSFSYKPSGCNSQCFSLIYALGNAQEAEDVAQETFVRAWKALPRFRAESRLSTWLYRIATNLWYNRLPHLKRELAALDPDVEIDLPDGRPGVEDSLV